MFRKPYAPRQVGLNSPILFNLAKQTQVQENEKGNECRIVCRYIGQVSRRLSTPDFDAAIEILHLMGQVQIPANFDAGAIAPVDGQLFTRLVIRDRKSDFRL
jgi:hypothetical protein